ncbi:MAG: hypothetical protein ACPG5Y_06275, partial [Pseudomonadales bacterium]
MNTNKPSPIRVPRKPQYVTVTSKGDFFDVFKKVAAEYDHCFMLESLGEDSHISRHSLIGFDPQQTISARGQELTIEDRDGQVETYTSDNPYYLLRELV